MQEDMGHFEPPSSPSTLPLPLPPTSPWKAETIPAVTSPAVTVQPGSHRHSQEELVRGILQMLSRRSQPLQQQQQEQQPPRQEIHSRQPPSTQQQEEGQQAAQDNSSGPTQHPQLQGGIRRCGCHELDIEGRAIEQERRVACDQLVPGLGQNSEPDQEEHTETPTATIMRLGSQLQSHPAQQENDQVVAAAKIQGPAIRSETGELGLAASRHAPPQPGMSSISSHTGSRTASLSRPAASWRQPESRATHSSSSQLKLAQKQGQTLSNAAQSWMKTVSASVAVAVAVSPPPKSSPSRFQVPMPPPQLVTSLPEAPSATSPARPTTEPPPLASSTSQQPDTAAPEPSAPAYHLEGLGLDVKASSSQRRRRARVSRACRRSQYHLNFLPDSDRGRRLTFSTDDSSQHCSSPESSPRQRQPLRATTAEISGNTKLDTNSLGLGLDRETAATAPPCTPATLAERRGLTSALAARQQPHQLPPSLPPTPLPTKSQRTKRLFDVLNSDINAAENKSPPLWEGIGLYEGVGADTESGVRHTMGGGWDVSTAHDAQRQPDSRHCYTLPSTQHIQVPGRYYDTHFDPHLPSTASVAMGQTATAVASRRAVVGTPFSQITPTTATAITTATTKLHEGLLVGGPDNLDERDSGTVRDLIDTKSQEWRLVLSEIRRATEDRGVRFEISRAMLGGCQNRRRELEHDLEGRVKGAYEFLLMQGGSLY